MTGTVAGDGIEDFRLRNLGDIENSIFYERRLMHS